MRGLQSLECVLTTGCNLACSYCHQGNHQPGAMSWVVLRGAIDRLWASDVEERILALTGGEPVMEWSLVQRAVEYAVTSSSNGRRVRLALTTNGLLLDEQKTRFLVAHDVEVQLSFDGVGGAHELRAPGTFDVLDHLFERLRSDHPSWYRRRLSIGMTLSSANLPFLSRSIGMLQGWGITSIRLAPLMTHDEGWGPDSEGELGRQIEAVFEFCLEQYRCTGTIPFELFRRTAKRPEANPERLVCKVRSPETQAVGLDGSVADCPLLLASEAGGTRSAPVLQNWAAQPSWPGRRRDRYSSWGRCRDCEFIDECLVCPVASANIPGNTDPKRVPDSNCAFNRIVGRYRRRFPVLASAEDHLRGEDQLPTAMTDLAKTLGME